jgi:hypothetical protein
LGKTAPPKGIWMVEDDEPLYFKSGHNRHRVDGHDGDSDIGRKKIIDMEKPYETKFKIMNFDPIFWVS